MSDPTRRHQCHREPPPLYRRRQWCCSFTTPPLSPDHSTTTIKKTIVPSASPLSHTKPPLSRRIISPGRVSPISDNTPPNEMPKPPEPSVPQTTANFDRDLGKFDVRLSLKGRNGGSLILELSSEVLIVNSSVFADLISKWRRNSNGMCRIELPDVENVNVFRETIEMMFEDEDVEKKLVRFGVFRAIDILEVSAGIKFSGGVSSCFKYLEAVPWTEEEEEKLRELLARLKFDDAVTTGILDRLSTVSCVDDQRTLAKQLICAVTTCTNSSSRNEIKSLVKGLLCKSSVYEKNYSDLSGEDILTLCKSCLSSLVSLFEEAFGTGSIEKLARNKENKSLLECVSVQVDNLNWMLDILLDRQMAEDFVELWANQRELLKMHEVASPIVRYELSRVSAALFIAMGTSRLHCPSETRLQLLQTWFRPMLLDFGWLKRCRKGLDMKALEEAMGQSMLTLPLREQYDLFMDWFRCFSKNGTECPNLSKSFQIWWRRSFLKGPETFSRGV